MPPSGQDGPRSSSQFKLKAADPLFQVSGQPCLLETHPYNNPQVRQAHRAAGVTSGHGSQCIPAQPDGFVRSARTPVRSNRFFSAAARSLSASVRSGWPPGSSSQFKLKAADPLFQVSGRPCLLETHPHKNPQVQQAHRALGVTSGHGSQCIPAQTDGLVKVSLHTRPLKPDPQSIGEVGKRHCPVRMVGGRSGYCVMGESDGFIEVSLHTRPLKSDRQRDCQVGKCPGTERVVGKSSG